MAQVVEKQYWKEVRQGGRAPIPQPPRALGGARARQSTNTGAKLVGGAMQMLAPLSADTTWRNAQLDNRALDRLRPAQLLELLADISPEISSAIWNFLRLGNPGYTAKALRPSGSDAPKATQDALKALLGVFKARHGDFSVVIGRLLIGAFLRGGFFAELILDKTGRVALDIATPDPDSVRFRETQDPHLGAVWELGQFQNGQFVSFSGVETIRYVPVDPFPGSPYGRSLASPALFPCLFLISLLHDLKRVVQQQGYPRLDVELVSEQITKLMPSETEEDPEVLKLWIGQTTEAVASSLKALEPDDTFVHTDAIKMNRPVGAVDSSSLGAIDGLMKALERMATRALKSMPLLMGTSEGTSEANANRQWEIHAAGIKALQHLCEGLLEHLLTLAMQAQGYACTVEFRFAELRAAERLRDAQTETVEITNAKARYDAGWISQDEAAMAGAKKAKADVPEPRSKSPTATLSTTDPASLEAEPGSNR